MKRILIYSDLHLEHAEFTAPPDLDYDIVVLAGDISSNPRASVAWAGHMFREAKAVLYVPGNHEFYGGDVSHRLDAMLEATNGTNVYVMHRGAIRVDGIRFLGCTLWTDFELHIKTGFGMSSDRATAMRISHQRMLDYTHVDIAESQGERRRLRPEDTARMHKEDRKWLIEALARDADKLPTVVMTHMAPHRRSLAPRYEREWVSASFVNELPPEFFETPKLWIHGHTHTSFDYKVGGCRVICNPRGYPMRDGSKENSAFNPALIVEI